MLFKLRNKIRCAATAQTIRTAIAIVMAVSLWSGAALAQGARYDSVAQSTAVVLGVTAAVPLPGSSVTLCNYPASGQTSSTACTNKTSVYTDQTLGVTASNPVTADSQGNFGFWAAPALYDYVVCTPIPAVCSTPFHLSLVAGQSLTAGFTAPKAYGVRTVDGITYANIAAAQTDMGTTNPALGIIPYTYSGTDCPAVNTNTVWMDYRQGGRVGSGTSSFMCTQNIIQYNTFTPGFTDAMIRPEMTRSSINIAGSAVALYPLMHALNMTNAMGVADGAATEVDVDGTVTGTWIGASGNESNVTVTSTGGNITQLWGTQGYIWHLIGSTTTVQDAVGLYGYGCAGDQTIHPFVNCWGAKFKRQGTFGSGRNYSFGAEGIALFQYSSSDGIGGFDCEDTGNVTHHCLYMDSSGFLNIQAVSVSGLNLAASTGSTQINIASNAVNFFAAPTPQAAAFVGLGKAGLPWADLFLGTAGTTNFHFVPAATAAARQVNLPDPGATTNLGFNLNATNGVYQSKRAVAGCTTAASVGGSCASDITVTWPTAFADANYSVSCSGMSPSAGFPSNPYIVSKAAGNIHVNYFAVTAVAAAYTSVDCEATHD